MSALRQAINRSEPISVYLGAQRFGSGTVPSAAESSPFRIGIDGTLGALQVRIRSLVSHGPIPISTAGKTTGSAVNSAKGFCVNRREAAGTRKPGSELRREADEIDEWGTQA